jgi:hypothetical protein
MMVLVVDTIVLVKLEPPPVDRAVVAATVVPVVDVIRLWKLEPSPADRAPVDRAILVD